MPRGARWFSALLFAGSLVAVALPCLAVRLDDLVDPRPGGWVVDQAGALSAETESELNRLGERVKAETGAELAVVVIDTTEGVDAHRFALDLANRWGLGDAQRDDGLLVFVALEGRTAEIQLGIGIDSDANVRASERIMQGTMVPRFRAGDPEGAVLAGAKACAEKILGLGAAGAPQSLLESPAAVQPEAPEQPLAPPATEPDPSADREGNPAGAAWLVALAAALLGGAGWLARKLTPGNERCPRCKQPMVELDEAADDAHLAPGELAEERVGSVNWRVWACSACAEVAKRPRRRWLSSYSRCAKCGSKTRSVTHTRLVEPTYTQGGVVRVDERCAACSLASTYTFMIPSRTRPTRDDSSGSASRSGSHSSSSSSSRSSSSSSSRSGGRSSGRGASGRW